MENARIAEVFDEIGDLLELKGDNPFRVRSYRNAAQTVRGLAQRIEDMAEEGEDLKSIPDIGESIAKKISVTLKTGLQVDFRFFEERSFGAALLYFTGSRSHNIALRKIARKKDWKLNEYGVFSGDKLLAGKTEEDLYSRLGCDYIPPELREDSGEVDAAQAGELPDLIETGDINGDLHTHTKATDGHNTIREMAAAARERGYKYLAITDHSKYETDNRQ